MNRIIMHIDMNSYFASVEQQANPFLRGKPIGVTGKRKERSVVAAASIEAKRLGVKTAMSTWEAKRVCPSIILVSGDPEKYGEITKRFNIIFKKYTPCVERFSVDESFLDLTDVAQDYLGAILIGQMIRLDLKKQCGDSITASIGIAPNKLVAKLASETHKPNGLTAVLPNDVQSFVEKKKLTDFCGIGKRIETRLSYLGITKVKQLREYPLQLLIKEFKSYGYWLHRTSFGIDNNPVTNNEEDPKSIGHSYTLPKNTEDHRIIKSYLLILADKVAWRLRRDGYAARCVTVSIRYDDFSGVRQQRCFTEHISDGLKIFQIAWNMVQKSLSDNRSVRLVGISTSMLHTKKEASPLFKKEQKMLSAVSSLDKIQSRYGDQSWTRASTLSSKIFARSSGFAYDHEL